jgi:xylan 1,4-beta-xylosidase
MSVEFFCDLSQKGVDLPHCWEHAVGSCHAPLALRSDWQQQLRHAHTDLGFRYVRFHGLLSDDVGTLVRHQERLLRSFFNADQIFDFLISIGMRPFVELSFMPSALASGRKTVFHYRGNVTPPRDFKQWGKLIAGLAEHWVDRYGSREVSQWFFEVWNEPNLKAFWTGTQRDYFKLYQHSVTALKGVEPSLRVGGPATAQNAWIPELLDFCETHRLPVDFVSTHHYPTDIAEYQDDDTETQLTHSRRSIMREWAQDARRRARGLPLYYTEWNTSSNPRDPRHDEPYAAAFVTKTALEASGIVDGYSFWTFSDIFEENYFPSIPFHGGFGLLNLHGVAKPAYRAFQLLHHLGHERLLVDGLHDTVDAWIVRNEHQVTVMMTNHALPGYAIQPQNVHVQLTNARHPRAISAQRIDETHANAKRVWRELEEPEYLNRLALERLHGASSLVSEPYRCRYADRTIDLEIDLPAHAVTAVTFELAPND